LSLQDIVLYSDGSEDEETTGYGYVMNKDERQIAVGEASSDNASEVFTAEAIAAWMGLEGALA
jgi:hypothetical protein